MNQARLVYSGPGCTGTETEDIANTGNLNLDGIFDTSSLAAYSEGSDPNGANGKYFFLNYVDGVFNENNIVLLYLNTAGTLLKVKFLGGGWASTTSSTVTGNATAMAFISDPTANAVMEMIKSASATTFPYSSVSPVTFNGSLSSGFGEFQSFCIPSGPGGSSYGRWHWTMLATTFRQTFEGYSDSYCEVSTGLSNVLSPAGTPWSAIDYPSVVGFGGFYSVLNVAGTFAYPIWLDATGTFMCGTTDNVIASVSGASPPTADSNWNSFVTQPFSPFGRRSGFCLVRVGH